MGKFLKGDITGHINKMTLSATVGILSIFLVDFVDMYFLSILGESELAAAVGFAGVLVFMLTSIGIAIMIAMSALISRVIGKGESERAKEVAMNIYYFTLILSIPILIFGYIFAPDLLSIIGAKGETLEYALQYFRIVILAHPFLLIGMASNGLLRGLGDAKMSMMPTLIAGGVNIILDPILIFGFGWGIEGAASATAISRIALLGVALYGVYKHAFIKFQPLSYIHKDLKPILSIFIPAMVTNISTPIGISFMMKEFAEYGDDAVAGMAVLSRMIPVLFVYIFALSGVVGSIVGQNYGAELYERVQETIKKSILISIGYVGVISILLMIGNSYIITLFNLTGDGREVIEFYSYFMVFFFAFNAIIFVGNATFNVIDKAKYSMFLNILKSVIFLIPFVLIFSGLFGLKGIFIGEALAFTGTGIVTLYLLYKFIFKIEGR